MSNLKTSLAQSNEIIKASDFQFAFDNVVENMNILTLLLLGSNKDFVIGGKVTPYDNESLNINVQPILCGNSSGTFVYETSETKGIAITQATQDRVDIVQIKGIWEEYDKQQRAFTDFETELQTYQDVFTKKRFIPVIEVKQGEEGSPVAPTTDSGFIKIAEIKVFAGENEITEDNIFNITSDIPELENENWTNEKSKTYNIGYISDVNRRFRQNHNENGTHKDNVIGTNELNIGTGTQQINADVLPIGKDTEFVDITKSASTSILSALEILSAKIVAIYNDYINHGIYNFNGEMKISDLINEDKSLFKFFAVGTKTENDIRKFYIKFADTEILTLSENGKVSVGEINATSNNDLITKSVTDAISEALAALTLRVENIEENIDSTSYANRVLNRYKMTENPAIVATTEKIELKGLQIIDNVSLNLGDIVLVKNQENQKENGFYEVTNSNWVRISNFSKPSDFKYKFFEIPQGKDNIGKIFYAPKELFVSDTFGAENIEFVEFMGSVKPFASTIAYRDTEGHLQSTPATNENDCLIKKDITDTVEKSNQNAVSSNAVYEYYQAEQNHNIPRKVMKDITAYYKDGTLWKRLNGTDGFSLFEDIFVGDYFKMSRAITVQGSYDGEVGSDYVTIAGINTLQGNGDNTDMMYNHLVMVAGKGTEGKQHFGRRQMNSSNTTSGGYVGSAMYNTHIGGVASSGNVNGNINQQLYAEFGEHLKTTRELLSNSINASGYNRFGNAGGCSNNCGWYSCQAVLMSEVEVYGSIVWSSSGYDTGTANQQLPLFRFSTKAQNNRTAYYWLKGVASSAYFCHSDDVGDSGYLGASRDDDFVRPRFVIA